MTWKREKMGKKIEEKEERRRGNRIGEERIRRIGGKKRKMKRELTWNIRGK